MAIRPHHQDQHPLLLVRPPHGGRSVIWIDQTFVRSFLYLLDRPVGEQFPCQTGNGVAAEGELRTEGHHRREEGCILVASPRLRWQGGIGRRRSCDGSGISTRCTTIQQQRRSLLLNVSETIPGRCLLVTRDGSFIRCYDAAPVRVSFAFHKGRSHRCSLCGC